MSAARNMGVLAFASAALAVPHPQGGYAHQHLHGHGHASDSWGSSSDSWGSSSAAASGSAVSPASAASSGLPFPAGNTTAGWHDYSGLSATGSFVRVLGTARVTPYGYSLYSFEVR